MSPFPLINRKPLHGMELALPLEEKAKAMLTQWKTRWSAAILRKTRGLCFGILKFSVTVVTSALLALWLQPHLTESHSKYGVEPRKTASKPEVQTRSQNRGKEQTEELKTFYSQYIDDVMRVLRADKHIRLAKLEVPKNWLSYQQNPSIKEKGGSALRISATAPLIPVIAVSRQSKSFLEDMRVTYVDPQSVPPKLTKAASLAPTIIDNFLLIPDLSGANQKKFLFGRK